jgi:hypothetical protein
MVDNKLFESVLRETEENEQNSEIEQILRIITKPNDIINKK